MEAGDYLSSLLGQTIYTLGQRRPNRILAIEGDDVIVATGRSQEGQPVSIESVQNALDRLCRDGELLVTKHSVGYRSAFIGAVLGTLPDVEVLLRPRRVRLTKVCPTRRS
jgi:hypothetical protein